ncbi:hypothetical protein EK69_001106 [Salmonella enterica subsp. enterica]|nr:hypothetical protein [Salmonella enterica subsp. enterica serovar Kua]ECH9698514.1 hypothetical protein [Salmonella enterica subsp. enterica]EDW1641005.1 hypothetical protein [Salmonella enterica subsp. enterica serovar Baguida]EEJ9045599.1 hypothetical protein [Salmonella enterica subsp. enterica]
MLNVYVICNNALVHKQYFIANSTERVQWFLLTTGLKIALEPIPLGLFYLPFWSWAVLKILTYYVYAPVFARCPCPNWLRQ